MAQKYEAEDSVTLAGVAVLVDCSPRLIIEGSPFDSLTVEIWDDALSSVLLSKTFICAESQEHLFYECMFNEPITLYNDYYVSVRMYRADQVIGIHTSYQCLNFGNSLIMIMLMSLRDAI